MGVPIDEKNNNLVIRSGILPKNRQNLNIIFIRVKYVAYIIDFKSKIENVYIEQAVLSD